nr:CLAVATA3/ESR (CLE)-related protein [Ipomoea batatas]GMD82369.1 CLAVATA3/ESR (CLE)-related protein [Ipomoea batatas]GME21604.1 CLAVATA3/ESR (CLE)-related protein [Ipomoea batatas]
MMAVQLPAAAVSSLFLLLLMILTVTTLSDHHRRRELPAKPADQTTTTTTELQHPRKSLSSFFSAPAPQLAAGPAYAASFRAVPGGPNPLHN